jgi:inositol transport system substrate-binding protein
MKSFKVLTVCFVVFLLLGGAALFAGGDKEQEGKGEEQIVMGALWQNMTNEFLKEIQGGARRRSEELGVKLLEADGQGKPEVQISQCENYIAQGVDAVILHPYDRDGCAPIVDMCNEAGIPIVLCNSRTTNMDEASAFVGSDDVNAGKIEMQFIADKLNGKGNIVIIHGPNGHSAEINRTKGNYMILEKYPDIKVLAEQTANWDRAQAMELTENWLTSGNPINAVVAQNDEMAMGALLAIEAMGKQDDIFVIGIDAIADARQAVKDGRLDATVFQDGQGQGYGSVDVAHKLINGEDVPFMNDIPFVLITQENIDEYL